MILLLLASLLLEWAISMHAALLAEGAKGLANQAVALVNQHYRTEFLSWLVPEPASGKAEAFLVLCAILGSLEGLIASFANKKRVRNPAFLCIPLLVFAAGVFVGKAPHTEGVLLALAGFFALQLEPGMRGMLPLAVQPGACRCDRSPWRRPGGSCFPVSEYLPFYIFPSVLSPAEVSFGKHKHTLTPTV